MLLAVVQAVVVTAAAGYEVAGWSVAPAAQFQAAEIQAACQLAAVLWTFAVPAVGVAVDLQNLVAAVGAAAVAVAVAVAWTKEILAAWKLQIAFAPADH